jgi:hypothetical protein
MVENLKLENFSPHLNSKFAVKRETESAVELELVEAVDLGSTPRQEQFSILFRGPLAPKLQQAIYQLEHQEIGAFELFIVPVKRGEDGIYYEAVFNRSL